MIFVIGFLAQICFSARIILQWMLSEKAKKVVSPSIFWKLSLIGAYLLFIYGWLRNDFAIILGQFISYYIYIWNLNQKKSWKGIPTFIRYLFLLTPVVALGYVLAHQQNFFGQFFKNADIHLGLIIFGSLGQLIFTLRFIYQWFYSYRKHESLLPLGFWIISLTGALLIVSYAFIRHDPVLILGQSVGLIAYSRNIYLLCRSKREIPGYTNAQG